MIPIPSVTGGAGGAAGPSKADQSSSSNQSTGAIGIGSGGGSRGFVNNVAFPGASVSQAAPINMAQKTPWDWRPWAAGSALLLVVFLVVRRFR